ncbi:MAG: UDP-N-acetylmuramate dehydrogenase [Gammaproteobacteria bacterium]|nr:UDP-N-acetylmuramate dehydrogenase [Gammaproteobacteria bacterium]
MNAAPEFLRGLRGQLRLDEPMSRHTSWRVGGAAEYFYAPADRDDLVDLLRRLPPDMPLHWVGLGSNLLVRDGGIQGMVIKASKGLGAMRFPAPEKIHAEAGVPCAKVARASVERGLAGAEFLAGVPGTLGGALAMNAGAFGGETWDLVEQIECVGRGGECSTHRAAEIDSAYRKVKLPARKWVLSALLALRRDGNGGGKRRIREMLKKRGATQPVQSANAGSVFRNPDGDHAARLIEQAGLKGARAGDAVISETHANFIINRGGAAAADIEELIDTARREVMRHSGVELSAEVRIIGRRA